MASQPAGNHTALLVEAGDARLLLDCGPAIMAQLERAGLDAGSPTHLYLSHQHGDHILGLPMLLLERVISFPGRALSVLAMPVVLQAAQSLVASAYPDLGQKMAEQIAFIPLVEADDGLPWPGVAGLHYRLARCAHSVPTYALRLDWVSGQSMVFSSDTGPSPAVARLATGANLLVHDTFYLADEAANLASHSAADQVGRLAAQAGVEAVALVHRMHTAAAFQEQYRAAAAAEFCGEILAPAAGHRFDF